jgi:hypothetical protein
VGDELLEPVAYAAIVSAELLRPEGHALAGPEHDVHELGRKPLDASNLLGVEAELKDVVGLRVPSELRVDDLVATVGLTLEEVSTPSPAGGIAEDGLIDHVAGATVDEPFGVGRVARLGDVPARRAKRSEVSGFVLVTLAPDQVGLWVIDVVTLEFAASDPKLERDQMLALEETIYKRRRDGGDSRFGRHLSIFTALRGDSHLFAWTPEHLQRTRRRQSGRTPRCCGGPPR